MHEKIFKISLVAITITIIVVLLIKRFVYFRPSSEFIPFKDTYQNVSEGNIHGWFVKGTGDTAILFCHGNAGNISHRQNEIDALNNLGHSVMIFDYSGYGKSIGLPSEEQLYQDASVYAQALLKTYDKNKIVLYGESIGAPVATYVARKYQIGALIIDSGLPSIKKLIKSKYGFLGVLGFLFPEFDTELYLYGYRGRVLVMHSTTDEIIPYDSTEGIRKYATKIINLSGTHKDRTIPWKQVDEFIKNS